MLADEILSSVGDFCWLQMWITLYKCSFRISVDVIQILGDLRKGVVLSYMPSDLLTLKFQYLKVIHVTSSFVDVVLKAFRYLLANAAQEYFFVSRVSYDFYLLSFSFLDYFKKCIDSQTYCIFPKKTCRRTEAEPSPVFFTWPAEGWRKALFAIL